MSQIKATSLGMLLESIAVRIFEGSGYKLEQNCNTNIGFDFVVNNDNKAYCVEVKATTSLIYRNYSALEKSLKHLAGIDSKNNIIPVLMVFATVPDDYRREIKDKYKTVVILDLSNILFATQGTNLQEELISILPFSIDQVLLVEDELGLGWIEHNDNGHTLIRNIDDCLAGREHASKYEEACFDMLRFIFADDLSLWSKQPFSNKDLYRFDLLCRIKDNTEKTFWLMMEHYFNSKYIIFEFKNYENKITQKEIYTTERYLYRKALRSVAIIVAKNGFDENSLWATKGSLRENGKLLLIITVDDLKTMCQLKMNQQDPSQLLLDKVDELLMTLEK